MRFLTVNVEKISSQNKLNKQQFNVGFTRRYVFLFAVLLFHLNFSSVLCTKSQKSQQEVEIPEEGWGTLVAVTAMQGSTALLPCNIDANDPSTNNQLRNSKDPVLLVLWYKNASVTPVYSYDSRGQTSGPQGRQQWGDNEVWGENSERVWFETSSNPAKLMIRDVKGRDEGAYRCKVHFKSSPSWSQRIDLIVEDPPGFPRIQDESETRLEGSVGPYRDGSVVRIICQSSGEPPPRLEWTGLIVEGKISNEVEDKITRSSATIVASRDTAGVQITCNSLTNKNGKLISHPTSITFNVNLPPLLVQLEAPGAWVVGGQMTEFRCRVAGAQPKAIVQWWLAGRQLTRSIRTEVFEKGNVTVSSIKLVPKSGDDETLLVCKAFSANLPGTVMQDQLTLRVHYVPESTIKVSSTSTVKLSSSGVDGQQGTTVVFTCHVQANPAAYNVTWFHNGKPIQDKQINPRIVIDQRTLRLLNISSDSHGLYTCIASNQEGDGQSNALNLNVFYVPTCRNDLPNEYIVEKGGSVTIMCGVKAFPSEVTFSWAVKTDLGEIQRLPTVGRPEGLTGKYMLTNIKDDLIKVLCWAKNSIGVQDEPCLFNVLTQGRPNAVSDCKVTNHTTSGFLVACPKRQQFHGGLEATYSLQVYAQSRTTARISLSNGEKKNSPSLSFGALDDLVRNLSSSQPQFSVLGLKSGREFAVVIRASNAEGTSPPSVLSAFTLRDTAQTLKGMPSATQGSGAFGKKKKANEGGTVSETKGKTDYDEYLDDEEFSIESMVSSMVLIIGSLFFISLLVSALVLLVLRNRRQKRRKDRELKQIQINEEHTEESSELGSPNKSKSSFSGSILQTSNLSSQGNFSETLDDTKALTKGRLDIEHVMSNMQLASPIHRLQIEDGSVPPSSINTNLQHILPSSYQLTTQSTVHAVPLLPSMSVSHVSPSANIIAQCFSTQSSPITLPPHKRSGVLPTSMSTSPIPSIAFSNSSTVLPSTSMVIPLSSMNYPSPSLALPSSTGYSTSTFHMPKSTYTMNTGTLGKPSYSHIMTSTISPSSTLPRRPMQSIQTAAFSGDPFPVPSKEDSDSQISQSQLPLLGVKQLATGEISSQHYSYYQGCQKRSPSSSLLSGGPSKLPSTQDKGLSVSFHPVIHVNVLPSTSPPSESLQQGTESTSAL